MLSRGKLFVKLAKANIKGKNNTAPKPGFDESSDSVLSKLPTTSVEDKCASFLEDSRESPRRSHKVVDYRAMHNGKRQSARNKVVRKIHYTDDVTTTTTDNNQVASCPDTPAGNTVESHSETEPAENNQVNNQVASCPDTLAGNTVESHLEKEHADNNQVNNQVASCPDSLAGNTVESHSETEPAENNQVNNQVASCPDTLAGNTVESHLEKEHADNNQVNNQVASCPDTPAGNTVESHSETEPAENNQVNNQVASCPDTPAGNTVKSHSEAAPARTRKRKRNPVNWTKNSRKRKNEYGEAHNSVTGGDVAHKVQKPVPSRYKARNGYKRSDLTDQMSTITSHLEAVARVEDASRMDNKTCRSLISHAGAVQSAESAIQNAIHQDGDGSFIIPAEVLSAIDIGGSLEFTHCDNVLYYKHSRPSPSIPINAESESNFGLLQDVEGDSETQSDIGELEVGGATTTDVEADDVSRGSRKRKRNPLNWAKNIRKTKSQRGEAYTSVTGAKIADKVPKPVPCRCKASNGYKCAEFSEDDRIEMCRIYWQLADYNRKKDWLIGSVVEAPVARRRMDAANAARKGRSLQWYLPHNDGRKKRVCKAFFCSTISIGKSAAPVMLALKGKSSLGTFSGDDNRGKHTPWNKTPERNIAIVHEHVNSIPKMASHYCRQSSRRQYIDADLTIPKLYELYVLWLKMKATENPDDAHYQNPVSERRYRDIFLNDFNISQFHPKKDQCMLCETWKTLSDSEKEQRQHEKIEHDRSREESKRIKEMTKEECLNDSSRRMVTFDLEAILQLPCGQVSQLYYKRKLVVYNFTLYESPGGHGTCFLWNETEGSKGSDEIGTCLLNYLMSLPTTVSQVDLFSDNCGGQNKNIQVVAACLYAVNNISHLHEIRHTFLETGHTHMECDSMHAAIEHAKRNLKVHSMGQWEGILQMARRKMPYQVNRLNHSSFYDLKSLVKQSILNKKKDIDGNTVNWRKVRSLCYQSTSPHAVLFKYDLAESFNRIDVSKSRNSRQRAKGIQLLQKYDRPLPISMAKKNDLLELCNKNVIHADYHAWYRDLTVADNIVDRVPLPAVDDDSSSED